MPTPSVGQSSIASLVPTLGTVQKGVDGKRSQFAKIAVADFAAGQTLVQLYKNTLGAAVASVTISSIPQTYSALFLQASGRTSGATVAEGVNVQVGNGSVDTGANYEYQYLVGTGAGLAAADSVAASSMFTMSLSAATATANYSGGGLLILPRYADTNLFKSVLGFAYVPWSNVSTGHQVQHMTNIWKSTAAIDTIKVFTASTFIIGTQFVLWGLP